MENDDEMQMLSGHYTVADWEHLPGDRRAELMDGVLYDMANPALVHQLILSSLLFQLLDYVEKNHGGCRVIPAPIGVRLEKDNKTMLEPDLVVVCSPEKLHPKWLEGAPDLVIEILSPSTRHRDLTRKFSKYESAGVRSYWVIDPEKKRILVYNLNSPKIILGRGQPEPAYQCHLLKPEDPAVSSSACLSARRAASRFYQASSGSEASASHRV